MWLGAVLPEALGRRAARVCGEIAGRRRDWAQWQAVRRNLAVVAGPGVPQLELDRLTRQTFGCQAQHLYDLARALARPECLAGLVELTPAAASWLERAAQGQALVIACPHLGAFDLAGLAAARWLAERQPAGSPATRPAANLLVLAHPRPTAAYRRQNELRRAGGLDVRPLGPGALRAALKHLEAGGSVITAADWPQPCGAGLTLPFFNRPARMPVVHLRLAACSGAALLLAACLPAQPAEQPGPAYRLDFAGPFPPPAGRDPAVLRAAAVAPLAQLETWIRGDPAHWAMFRDVWTGGEAARSRD